ncbi:prealbumin-like fold domain-containing protein [Zhihengliuella flava]|uniref:Ig-like domain-containing protein n=1 Tax=Zhihengliuella flava TaxID=1285193 RepID=A0A931D822_9MICC|nr:prealbumin-like fold domain-containing protein [Zhihengliuella flava]MBG6085375.1 hypothetical protein [Zhihengliuella flava]
MSRHLSRVRPAWHRGIKSLLAMGVAAGLMFSGSVAMATSAGLESPAPAEETAATEPAESSAAEVSARQAPAEESAPDAAPEPAPAVEEPPAEEPAPSEPVAEPAPEPAPIEGPAITDAPEPPAAKTKQQSEAKKAPETTEAAEESEAAPEASAVEMFASPSQFLLDWPADIDQATDPIGNADTTVYSQGSKENDPSSWQYNGSAGAPDSGDVGDTWVAAEYDSSGDAWLWLAFERTTANGQIGYFLELNQAPATTNSNGATVPQRTVGDLRITFPANGSNFSTPQIQEWNGSTWVSKSLPAGSWDQAISQGSTLVEFKFNLSAIFGGADGILDCGQFDFASLMLRSAASASPSSQLKDFVGGSINIDLCAGLTILKTDASGNPLGGASFEVSPNPLPGESGTLSVTDNDSNDANPAAGTIELAEVNPGTYTVTETAAPAGYLLPADRDQGPQTVSPGGSVTFTFADPRAWQPLTVTKTIQASYTATHAWDIEKTVDRTRVEQSATTADFNYVVTVTEGERTTSDYVVSGQITVNNPNPAPMVATVEDVLSDGTVCVVDAADASPADGLQVQFAAGTNVLSYECEVATEPADASGSNEVTLTWNRGDYPQTQSDVDDPESAPVATASDEESYEWQVNNVDRTITVEDSQYQFDPAWEITWSSAGTEHVKSYTLTRSVTAGECQTFDNTATIVETGQSSSTQATLCVGADLVVEKNVIHSFDRTYLWEIEKSALGEQPFAADPATGDVTVEYEVTVGPDSSGPGFQDSGWAMSGGIEVFNPNTWQDIEVTVTDVVDIGGGAECTVLDSTRVVAAGEKETFDYTCTFTSEPEYEGENVATATWDAEAALTPNGSDTGSAPVEIDEWSVTPINQTITVVDDHFTFDPAWTITWSDGMQPQTRTYELTWNVGEAGQCQEFVNTATVLGDNGLPLTGSEASAQACREAALVVDKSIDGSFDRLYLWDITKGVDPERVMVGQDDAVPEVEYSVVAVPGGVVDSGFVLGGSITVSNPNTYESGWIVAEVEDQISVDSLVCTVADDDLNPDGTVTIAPSSSVVLDYSCTTDGVTAETTGENVAVVSWADGARESMSDPVPVEFVLDGETDRVVEVYDDQTDPEAEPVLLGSAEWNADGVGIPFEYPLAVDAPVGECATFTNTAWVVVTGQDPEASAEVTVCREAALVIEKTVEASFDRTYLWDVLKDRADGGEDFVEADETGEATVPYAITVLSEGYVDSGFELGGVITITNPNVYAEGVIDAVVSDALSVEGAVCTVSGLGEGGSLTLEPEQSVELEYSCTTEGMTADSTGENTAMASWHNGERSASSDPVPFAFAVDTETDRTVEVFDDQAVPGAAGELLGTVSWDDVTEPVDEWSEQFAQELVFQVEAGTCETFTNTAWVEVTGENPQDDAVATVCNEADLMVSKSSVASFDRLYLWDVSKDVNRTTVTVGADDVAPEFDYTILATPDGFEDSGWVMSGEITIMNPNSAQQGPITATAVDLPEVEGVESCTVTGGDEVVIEAGQTRTLEYECVVSGQPAYEGSNTVEVTWDGGFVTASADVVFELAGETDKTVEVFDDQTDPEAEPALLGTATWNEAGESTEFGYTMALDAPAGQCTEYTNTAWVDVAGENPQDSQTVMPCREAALVVDKSIDGSFDRLYLWDITKGVDPERVMVGQDDAVPEVEYSVVAVPGGVVDSGFVLGGSITVSNPNTYESGWIVAEVEDQISVDSLVCTVADDDLNPDGTVTIAPSSSVVLDYSCTTDGVTAETTGENVAVVSWADGARESMSDPVPVEFVLDGETDRVVEVYDDQTDPEAEPVLLGSAEWNADGVGIPFEYPLAVDAPVGECATFTNTAWVVVTGQDPEASAEVTVCREAALVIEKTVEASFDRTYLWDVLKDRADGGEDFVEADETGEATVPYAITVLSEGYVDSGFELGGVITITNPNVYAEGVIDAVVSDALSVEGAVCTVSGLGEGGSLTLEPEQSVELEYSCTTEGMTADSTGENTAMASWHNGERSASSDPVPFAFAVDTETDRTVEVFDDQAVPGAAGELLGTVSWDDVTEPVDEWSEQFAQELVFQVEAGTCETFTNTAWVEVTGENPQDDAVATVCNEADLMVSKSSVASFDRLYLWDVSKDVNRTTVTVGADDVAPEFDYTILATPDGFEDSGWVMSGEITIMNPNSAQQGPITATAVDLPEVEGVESCTVTGGDEVVIEAGQTRTLEYECVVSGQPAYEGSNTVEVTWDGGFVTASADVVFELAGETDKTVEVFDDQTDPEAEPALLGTATWNEAGESTEFGYTMALDAPAGQCTEYTNTAWVDVAGENPQDSQTVMPCREAALVVDKSIDGSFDRLYLWDITKERLGTEELVEADRQGEADVPYLISVTSAGVADSGFALGGSLTVVNPNTYESGWIVAAIEHEISIESLLCTVADDDLNPDGTVTIAPSSSVVLDYSCTTDGVTAETTGENVAVVSWADGDRSVRTAPAAVEFVLDGETDRVVEVYDDQTDPEAEPVLLGTVSWDEVDPSDDEWSKDFEQELTFTVDPGTCQGFVNTAWVEVTGENPEDNASVTVCHEAELLVSKSAQATFDRTYLWEIDKDVEREHITVAHDGDAPQFNYAVTATPDGHEDSNWMLSGQITVTNPNSAEQGPIVASIADQPGVEGVQSCTIAEGETIDIQPGETLTLNYECRIDGEPALRGENVVVLTWDGGAVTATADVVFEVAAETNKSVDVVDDQANPDAAPTALGTAEWNDAGEPTTFEYVLTRDVAVGDCETFTNTATLVETEAEATADAEACREATPPVKLPPTGLNAGWMSALGFGMLLFGAAALIMRHRRS